jgi:hypothetical protein
MFCGASEFVDYDIVAFEAVEDFLQCDCGGQ